MTWSVQGNVSVEVRASYREPVSHEQRKTFMHERPVHPCSLVFAFRMHLALRHVQSKHAKQDTIVLTRGN